MTPSYAGHVAELGLRPLGVEDLRPGPADAEHALQAAAAAGPRDIRRNSQNTKMNGSSRNRKYSSSVPTPELGGVAVTDFTPSAVSCWLSCAVGWPGITVVYDVPLVSSPVAVVFEPLEPLPKSTVLILWALASAMNCE